jgi:hypothetical protein
MHQALYPHPITDRCPYCGSSRLHNDLTDSRPDAVGCSIECQCADCGQNHRLTYRLESITLENDRGESVDYYVGQEIPDMGADEPDAAPKALLAAVVALDGLCIMARGYGDGGSARGHGCPVIIEQYNGELRICPWTDINRDDCGEVIPLGGASFENEDPRLGPRYALRLLTPGGEIVEEHLFESIEEARASDGIIVPAEHVLTIVDRHAERTGTSGTEGSP